MDAWANSTPQVSVPSNRPSPPPGVDGSGGVKHLNMLSSSSSASSSQRAAAPSGTEYGPCRVVLAIPIFVEWWNGVMAQWRTGTQRLMQRSAPPSKENESQRLCEPGQGCFAKCTGDYRRRDRPTHLGRRIFFGVDGGALWGSFFCIHGSVGTISVWLGRQSLPSSLFDEEDGHNGLLPHRTSRS